MAAMLMGAMAQANNCVMFLEHSTENIQKANEQNTYASYATYMQFAIEDATKALDVCDKSSYESIKAGIETLKKSKEIKGNK